MRLYLSLPMSRANTRDLAFREKIVAALDGAGVSYWNPAEKDERGLTMQQVQELDFAAMQDCNAVLALWSETSYRSNGLLAELEWARRVFSIPAAILCQSSSLLPTPWASATARGHVFTTLTKALESLRPGLKPI